MAAQPFLLTSYTHGSAVHDFLKHNIYKLNMILDVKLNF